MREVLDGQPPDLNLTRALVRHDCSDALFRIVVEGLADRFEPRLCDAYATLFSEVLAELFPDLEAPRLLERYERIRVPRLCEMDPGTVFVLSRVTLGADIAVTSVVLEAARRRFPQARIIFTGSEKNAGLFPDFEFLAAPYPRTGSLRDRLAASQALRSLVDRPNSIVLDPDSRLTQLGLVPVCDDSRYFFFESRCFGGESTLALSQLASKWCEQVLGVVDAAPTLRFPAPVRSGIAISFGTGENPAKRLGDEFEAGLLRALSGPVVIDQGAGAEEAERVRRAVSASHRQVEVFSGAFADFARRIARSELYIGYDSAGQHAAAALGIPLVAIFRGQVSPRMFERWKPTGAGPIAIVDANELTPEAALRQTLEAVRKLSGASIFGDADGNPE